MVPVMSRYLPNEVFELEPTPKGPDRTRRAWGLDLRAWLFLGMGLAGILTVALIVTADNVYADIDAMRGLSASGPQAEEPAITKIPFLGGLISKIHDIAPTFFAPSPDSVGGLAPATPSPQPANSPSPAPSPAVSVVPAAQPPSSATPAPAPSTRPTTAPSSPSAPVSGPSAVPTAAPSVAPTAAPTVAPTPSPSPTAAPMVAISTDQGGTAVFDLTHLVPGDSTTRTITVRNTGSLAFRYTVSATQTASTLLWTDSVDGLQLTVRTGGGAVLYAGPLAGLGSLAGPTILAPGTTEMLSYTVAFPATAPNAFQGLTQDLVLVFGAIEFP
jgi:hypothetical protein